MMTINNGHASKCLCSSQTDDDCRRDLLHELSKRLVTVCRCHRYIMNANGNVGAIDFWSNIRQQEADNIQRIQALLFVLQDQQATRMEPCMLCNPAEPLFAPAVHLSHSTSRRIPVAT